MPGPSPQAFNAPPGDDPSAAGAPDPVEIEGLVDGSHPDPALRILFLDDDPQRAEMFLVRYDHAVWVQTAADCIEQLARPWDQVHLDHDLGGEHYVDSSRPDCGMEVVRWLCTELREWLRETSFIIHSHNAEAGECMTRSLTETGYRASYRPFGVDLLEWLFLVYPRDPEGGTPENSKRSRWRRILARVLPRGGDSGGPQ